MTEAMMDVRATAVSAAIEAHRTAMTLVHVLDEEPDSPAVDAATEAEIAAAHALALAPCRSDVDFRVKEAYIDWCAEHEPSFDRDVLAIALATRAKEVA